MGSLGSWQLYPTMHLLVLFKIICLVILWHIARTKIWRFSIEQPAVAACAVLVILCILDTPHFGDLHFHTCELSFVKKNRFLQFCCKILSLRFTLFFCKIFWTEKQKPKPLLHWMYEFLENLRLDTPYFGHPSYWRHFICKQRFAAFHPDIFQGLVEESEDHCYSLAIELQKQCKANNDEALWEKLQCRNQG